LFYVAAIRSKSPRRGGQYSRDDCEVKARFVRLQSPPPGHRSGSLAAKGTLPARWIMTRRNAEAQEYSQMTAFSDI
jgi:hypothetical protein